MGVRTEAPKQKKNIIKPKHFTTTNWETIYKLKIFLQYSLIFDDVPQRLLHKCKFGMDYLTFEFEARSKYEMENELAWDPAVHN